MVIALRRQNSPGFIISEPKQSKANYSGLLALRVRIPFKAVAVRAALPGPLVTHLVVLAVHCADPQQIEDGSPGPAFVLAFFFHADETRFGLVLAIILDQGDGIASQCVAPVAESRRSCDQGFIAGDE